MARNPTLQRLDAFVGEWTMEASFPDAPPTGLVGHCVFEWALDDQFLVQRSKVPHPDAPDGISIIGLAADGETYTQHYFDSRGIARVYAMTFRDGVWSLLRDSPDFTPLSFSQRFTGTFGDAGRTVRGRWEASTDGSTWELDFELTYRKG
jgi:hypothetical protein